MGLAGTSIVPAFARRDAKPGMKTFTFLFTALLAAAPAPLWAQTTTTTTTTTSTTVTTGTTASVGDPVSIPHEDQLIDAIDDYVRNTRSWPDGTYKVSFDRRDGDRLIFFVDFQRGDNYEDVTVADQPSFRVVVNPATKKVEQELYN